MNPDNRTNKKKWFTSKKVVIGVLVLILVVLAAVAWSINKKQANASNFVECKDAGGTVVEGMIATCEINGKTFKDTSQTDDSDSKGNANSETAREYLGLSEKDALEKAKADGHAARVVKRDGKDMMVTMDLRQGRLNFTIEDGVVTAVEEEAPDVSRNTTE